VKNNRGKTPLELANDAKNFRISRLIIRFMKKKEKNST
jgi:hypothetical protein